MHNIYPTNISLFRMGLKNSKQCAHCEEGLPDDIEHFFFHCSRINSIWKELKLDILIHMNLNINISVQTVLLGAHYMSDLSISQILQINRGMAIGKHAISKFKFQPLGNILDVYHREVSFRNLWVSANNH